MSKITEYHFDFGDTESGALGMCAVVRAETKKEAVKILQDRFADMENEYNVHDATGSDEDVQYIRLYFNHRNVSQLDIDDEQDIETEPEDDDYDEEADVLDDTVTSSRGTP